MKLPRYPVATLQAALLRLDQRLRRAVEIAQTLHAAPLGSDPFRGLYISQDDLEGLFARMPGEPILWSDDPAGLAPLPAEHPARYLQELFGLSEFETEVLLLALAVEVDLRYERLYAWLQDDATRRRPSVSLALDLLCESAEQYIAQRVSFAADSPLVGTGILNFGADSGVEAPLLSRALVLDEAVVRFLLGESGGDRRLQHWCQWISPTLSLERIPVAESIRRQLTEALSQVDSVDCHFLGPSGSGQRQAAEGLARASGKILVVADLSRLAVSILEDAMRALILEASLRRALIYLTGLDGLIKAGHTGLVTTCLDMLNTAPASVIVCTSGASLPYSGGERMLQVTFRTPSNEACRLWWSDRLDRDAGEVKDVAPSILSARFRLNLDQIKDAVVLAMASQPIKSSGRATSSISLDDLMAAARAVSDQSLARLSDPIKPVQRWSAIVLPDSTMIQLQELCAWVSGRQRVLEDWGFGARLASGKGCNALFAGPPGTGKTLAAEIIANELGLNLYRIDLAAVVSKYIGETEKNLAQIFAAAEQSNAVLLFDEADALFGKRSAVRDSHDRYANIEISFLLQRMEQYEGLAVLATNLAQNLDEAFVRRLAFTVHFPFPTAELRERIWESQWPPETPLADDIDHAWLARTFKFSGGNIRNAALAAAYLAAADGGRVSMMHVRQAVRREFQKMGKALSDHELGIGSDKLQMVGAR